MAGRISQPTVANQPPQIRIFLVYYHLPDSAGRPTAPEILELPRQQPGVVPWGYGQLLLDLNISATNRLFWEVGVEMGSNNFDKLRDGDILIVTDATRVPEFSRLPRAESRALLGRHHVIMLIAVILILGIPILLGGLLPSVFATNWFLLSFNWSIGAASFFILAWVAAFKYLPKWCRTAS